MHGLATGEETRQQLYTMLTRGRIANHVYLQVVGDGNPHSLIRPETDHPSTATEVLEQILARDGTPRSASTLERDQHDSAALLGDAASRYVDALYIAAEDLAGREVVEALEVSGEQIVPGLTGEPAWPTLRAHLLLLAANGADPAAQLAAAVCARELDSAEDRAAVVDWRLDDTGHRNAGPGPLPWLPGIPTGLRAHPEWGGYLTARSELVATLADRVRASVGDTDTPEWATQHGSTVPTGVLAEVQVWRAAMQVGAGDRRLTGPVQPGKAARAWQRHLDRQVAGDRTPALQEWGWLLDRVNPNLTEGDLAPVLASRLAAISGAGMDARQLLHSVASTGGPLPDDHAAAALWWRISRHLTRTVAAHVDTDRTVATVWTFRLDELLGSDRADDIQSSRWWPPLVAAAEQVLERGWRLDDLIRPAGSQQDGFDDLCQALLWRISVLTDPVPTDELYEPFLGSAPSDMWLETEPSARSGSTARDELAIGQSSEAEMVVGEAASLDWLEPDLAVAALVRRVAGPPEQTDADVDRMFTRAMAWRDCPIRRDRMLEINQMTLAYFRSHFPSSWGQTYLTHRFGHDLTEDPRFRPGQALAGWTALIHHLRSRGVPDQEMIVAGVATVAALSAADTPTAPMLTVAARSTSTPPTLPCSTKEPSSSASPMSTSPRVAFR